MASKRKVKICIVFAVLMSLLAMNICGCSNPRYKVDLGTQKDFYEGVKSSYKAGEEVTLFYPLVATDTDYSFYLNGERLNFSYDDKKGIIINFIMPDHDVKLECDHVNSMDHAESTEDILLFDYFYSSKTAESNDSYYELTLSTTSDSDILVLDEYIKDSDDAEEINNQYFIPYHVLDECMEIVHEYKLYEWNYLEDSISTDGALMVCKFKYGYDYIRVTSEEMPENGKEAFEKIHYILSSYIS